MVGNDRNETNETACSPACEHKRLERDAGRTRNAVLILSKPSADLDFVCLTIASYQLGRRRFGYWWVMMAPSFLAPPPAHPDLSVEIIFSTLGHRQTDRHLP